MSMTSIVSSIVEDPRVPNPNHPFSVDFVRRSPKVAPNGLVSTNAIQKRSTHEIRV